MDKQLQFILAVFDRCSGLSEKDKDDISQTLKKVKKAYSIAEFKLSRVLMEKHTTSVLLEETIDELQQKSLVLEQANNDLLKAYQELKAAQKQLIQSEKMASLGELTAGVAHEIQNPLNFINNFSEVSAELLQEVQEELSKGNTEEATILMVDTIQNIQKIIQHGKRADGIVKSMLQHSRQSKSPKEPTDINALTDEYLRLSYHGMRAKDNTFNVTIETQFAATVDKANVVSQDIGRVLLNLFNNAFYAVHAKRQLNKAPDYEPKVLVGTLQQNNDIIITVQDNGTGVPKELLDKIYQPFFTTKPTGQGTGLGLSLSYDIVVKGHSGRLDIETEEGRFAKFTVALPVS